MKKILLLLIVPLLFSCEKKNEDKKIQRESTKPTTPKMERGTEKNQQTIRPFDKIKSH